MFGHMIIQNCTCRNIQWRVVHRVDFCASGVDKVVKDFFETLINAVTIVRIHESRNTLPVRVQIPDCVDVNREGQLE